jgi:hypothetical protein
MAGRKGMKRVQRVFEVAGYDRKGKLCRLEEVVSLKSLLRATRETVKSHLAIKVQEKLAEYAKERA